MKQNYSLAQLASIYCVYKDLSPLTHNTVCCTCGKTIHIAQIEDCYNYWGHFIPRSINRNLIYYPNNSFAQCVTCNVYNNGNKHIEEQYIKYMQYRFGKEIFDELKQVKQQTHEYYKELYINLLIELIPKFSELSEVVLDTKTGEVDYDLNFNNDIEKQFYTYSQIFRQDLDTICKALKIKPVEWERL